MKYFRNEQTIDLGAHLCAVEQINDILGWIQEGVGSPEDELER